MEPLTQRKLLDVSRVNVMILIIVDSITIIVNVKLIIII